MKTLSDKGFIKNYQFAGKRRLYFEEDVKDFIKELKKIDIPIYKASNGKIYASMLSLWDKIDELAGEKLI